MSQVRLRILPLFVGLACGCRIPVAGQNTGEGPGAIHDAEHEVRQAAVIIDGEILFSVRGITARPADRRAHEIADKIREAAKNPKINAKSLTVEAGAQAARILADGKRIMIVLDEDAALEELDRNLLAEAYRYRIWEAIETYRHDRRPKSLGLSALQALGATVVLVVAAYLGRRLVALLRRGFDRRYRKRLETLEDRALHFVRVDQVWRALTGLLDFVWGLAVAAVLSAYVHYVLALFPWTRGLAKNLFAIAINPLRVMGLGLVNVIPNLVFLAILALLTRYILRMTRLLFDSVARGTVTLDGFDPEWSWPTGGGSRSSPGVRSADSRNIASTCLHGVS